MENRKLFHMRFYGFCLVALLSLGLVMTPYLAQAGEEKQETVVMQKEKDTTGNFARGARLWAGRCASCHNMRDPKDLPDDQWKAAVMHMRLRAGLTGQDTRDIIEFLQKAN